MRSESTLDGARGRARARARRRRLDPRGDRRQRPHRTRHRGREPALPPAGQALRRLLRARPGGAGARRSGRAVRDLRAHLGCRAATLVNEDATSTAAMHRSLEELAGWCVRENPVPAGTVLLTGTGIVPPDDVALAPGYRVEVEVEGIGVLANPVRAALTGTASGFSPVRVCGQTAVGVRSGRAAPRPPRSRPSCRHGSSRTPTSVLAGRDVAEERLAQGVDQRAVVDVGEVDVDLDDVGRRAAARPARMAPRFLSTWRTGRRCRRRRRGRRSRPSRDSRRRTGSRWPRRRRSSG